MKEGECVLGVFVSPQTKKKKLQNKTFSLFYKTISNFYILYHINHFSLLFKQKFHNSTIYQTHPAGAIGEDRRRSRQFFFYLYFILLTGI
jgi:hypothetical protein